MLLLVLLPCRVGAVRGCVEVGAEQGTALITLTATAVAPSLLGLGVDPGQLPLCRCGQAVAKSIVLAVKEEQESSIVLAVEEEQEQEQERMIAAVGAIPAGVVGAWMLLREMVKGQDG